jgi:hypothetical protein
MNQKVGRQVGGIKSAANSRWRSLQRYYSEPHYCKQCGYLIEIGPKEAVRTAKNRKFCCNTCYEKYYEQGVTRREAEETVYRNPFKLEYNRKHASTKESQGPCQRCKKSINYREKEGRPGLYVTKLYCDTCREIVRSETSKERHGKNALQKPIDTFTKGELLNLKGYSRYKALLVKHANKVFDESGQERKCRICGYSLVDICHIVDVSYFTEDTLISEINNLRNLVTLCPTHHREFDKKVITIEDSKEQSAI